MTDTTKRVILPAEATAEMMRGAAYAGYRHVGASESEAEELTERLLAKPDQASFSAAQWAGVIAASPTSGKVTEAEVANMLAAKPFEDGDETVEHIIIMGLAACGFKLPSTAAPDVIRAALASLGVEVE